MGVSGELETDLVGNQGPLVDGRSPEVRTLTLTARVRSTAHSDLACEVSESARVILRHFTTLGIVGIMRQIVENSYAKGYPCSG